MSIRMAAQMVCAGICVANVTLAPPTVAQSPRSGRPLEDRDPFTFCEAFLAAGNSDVFHDGRKGQMWAYPITHVGPASLDQGYVVVPPKAVASLTRRVEVTRQITLGTHDGVSTMRDWFKTRSVGLKIPFWVGLSPLVVEVDGFSVALKLADAALKEASKDGALSAAEIGILFAAGGKISQTATLQGDPPERWILQSTFYEVGLGAETRRSCLCSMKAYAP
jgi:hypothetical protein